MSARSIEEPNRVSSQLELLFDLTFVVAVASAVSRLAHAVEAGHASSGVLLFLEVFFAIWWAWMNFTWFASSYDTDDVAYRLMTMVQMAGVLILAAGVPAAADEGNFRTVTLGYIVMRIALVGQWVRAAIEDPTGRRTALRYAAGFSVLQVGWLARLVLAESGVLAGSGPLLFSFVVLAVFELAVPRWAERTSPTNWHPHHIAERYNLFTIILFGETLLAASTGVGTAVRDGWTWSLIIVAGSGLVLMFALWWLYSLEPGGEALAALRDRSYQWGYGHFGLFAALAALGAGLEVAVAQSGHHAGVSPATASYAVAIPVAGFLILLWAVHAPFIRRSVVRHIGPLLGAVAVMLSPQAVPAVGTAGTVALIAVVCVVVTALTIASRQRRELELKA
ncbi:low temperature requirement protein LtrA [Kibdelosporangium banguiense]|uniref:Low temperature requirement protein LtrA n=1 Tax=Kibdelosporangium banguiense TaxID=1365924 RepID=A0ABS4TQC7_9PSEU|nr:low temperature requirement protein A [Kibdelosporangium banguiense]MBP2326609.1 low temperature requirement protein LtrA [Kibdelosporangium banguiense]